MYKKMPQQSTRAKKQAGFTIVELMIATMVFSVILVVITVGVMYFTRSYYKGVYASMTQNAARDIADSVAHAVQFGTGDPTTYTYHDGDSGSKWFCAGGYVFVFNLGQQYKVGDAGTTGMYMQPMSNAGCVVPAGTTDRRQLLGDRMRVAFLDFTGGNGLYTLDLKVTYGDSDLLSNDSGLGPNLQCKLSTGSEYCAVARYTTSMRIRKT